MFNWLYKRIARGIMQNIDSKTMFQEILTSENLDSLIEKGLDMTLEKINSEDFLKGITPLMDSLYERYKAKAFSSIGGAMSGVSRQPQEVNPLALLGKGGKINWLGAIQMFMNRNQVKPQESAINQPSSESHNPY